MRAIWKWSGWVAALLVTCSAVNGADVIALPVETTSGVIAIANLDEQISQLGAEAEVVELLLARARFLGDYEALDRACTITEGRSETRGELLRRARTRSAVHRFAEALADVAAAERLGAKAEATAGLRSSILVATGRAADVIPRLEAELLSQPGFASRCALAGAYAAVGRLTDAEGLYVAALADLDTTSPFPYAWVYFARGLMWAEQGRDAARGEELYAKAISYLPQFAGAAIHLAELEVARGEVASAIVRLERVVASSNEPEALALLGQLHARMGDPERGRRESALAKQRYDSLLARQPLAFADHAAEFYLGVGADAERALVLAEQNLANRETDRALALAIKAAWAAGRQREACALARRARAHSRQVPGVACAGVP
jgi:tetratricopeptide (TPR) repeat protein